MLKIQNLCKIFKDEQTLKNISFNLPDKGLVCITGASGSGKSTLLYLLGGLDGSNQGDIYVHDLNITQKFDNEKLGSYRNNFVSFIFQEFYLLEELTVYDNIKITYEIQNKNINTEKVEKILQKLEINNLKLRKINQLSGGQKQRVGIARSLIKNSKMILADEPTCNLDEQTEKQVFDLLKEISKEKLVIVVTHNKENALKYGDRLIELKNGSIIKDISKKLNVKPIFNNDKKYYTKEEMLELIKNKDILEEKANFEQTTTKIFSSDVKDFSNSLDNVSYRSYLTYSSAISFTKNTFKNNKKLYFRAIMAMGFPGCLLIILTILFFNFFIYQNFRNLNIFSCFLFFVIYLFLFLNSFFQLNYIIKNRMEFKKKEIGILQSLGAFKKDIKKIFRIFAFKLSFFQSLGVHLSLVFIYYSFSSNDSFSNDLKSLIYRHFGINLIIYFLLSYLYPLFINIVTIKYQINKLFKQNPYPLSIILDRK
ncbi:MAG: ATP-binding cassette domain-containing protein [Candidatus Phytoplasma vitis]|nr:MAG: ATP-binding cassette domain-containing protein [Candidatus Phytoplasma vitis]